MVATMKTHVTGSPHKQPQRQNRRSKHHTDGRYTPSFTRKLEAELTGSHERGVRPPLIRIPGKTHLAAVLLTNNPWEQRDLDRKLEHIKKERERKEKALDWNQRHFFATQIFDQDYHLRFTRRRSSYSQQLQPTPRYGNITERSEHARTGVSSSDGNLSSVESGKLPEISKSGRGIFTKPLDWNLPTRDGTIRRTRSMPIKQTYSQDTYRSLDDHKERVVAKSIEMTADSEKVEVTQTGILQAIENESKTGETHYVQGTQEETNVSKENTSLSAIDSKVDSVPCGEPITSSDSDFKHRRPLKMRKSYTTLLDVVHEVPSSAESTLSCGQVAQPRLQKAVSLPQINLKASQSVRRIEFSGDRNDASSPSALSSASSDSSDSPRTPRQGAPSGDSICDANVISRITQTLPVSIMVRANQNINKIVTRQKDMMLERCRKQSKRDMFLDPRWNALKNVLVTMDHNIDSNNGSAK